MFNNPGGQPSKPANVAMQGRNPLKSFTDSMTRAAAATQRQGMTGAPQLSSSSSSGPALDQRLAGHMAGGPSAAAMDASFMNIDNHPMAESRFWISFWSEAVGVEEFVWQLPRKAVRNWAQEFDGRQVNQMRPAMMHPVRSESAAPPTVAFAGPAMQQPQQHQQTVLHPMPPQLYHQAPLPPPVQVPLQQQAVTSLSDATTAATVDKNVDVDAAKRMVETMRSSGNAKFANSQFVDFVDQIVKGDLQLADDKDASRAMRITDDGMKLASGVFVEQTHPCEGRSGVFDPER
ncbi:Peroxisomal membrane signal receptor PTS1 [Perkinsus olseni]|uniref:Peroxisomal membrane signal receptor PTS1 n=1 Tax=Perkinsus olseni TaxID=32597 RepID=A0A7J6NNQ5_PEROL|nr:Peroxisomal membrane signal receptor PTS1 [Perkinsus olseni]